MENVGFGISGIIWLSQIFPFLDEANSALPFESLPLMEGVKFDLSGGPSS